MHAARRMMPSSRMFVSTAFYKVIAGTTGISSVVFLENLRKQGLDVASNESYIHHGYETLLANCTLPNDPSLVAPFGQPKINVQVVSVPLEIATEFETIVRSFPGIEEFNPNALPLLEEDLDRFSKFSALILNCLFKKYSPETLNLLRNLELQHKGLGESYGPHVIIKNLNIGSVDTIPLSDDPKKDEAYYKAQAPYISEFFMLGMSVLMGFTVKVVQGEKGNGPIHYHVPVEMRKDSGTSVSFISPIACHTEDLHAEFQHDLFFLFGKLGNPMAKTPLISFTGFLSCIPEKDRLWVLEGMRLPFLYRPGAGRTDAAVERRVGPLIQEDWEGKVSLVFNGSDYYSLKTNEHMYRMYTLSPEFYENSAQHELAQKTLAYLRALFKDVMSSESTFKWPLCIETGNLVCVGNRIGPHGRTPFEGKRFLERLYVNAKPSAEWRRISEENPAYNRTENILLSVWDLLSDVQKCFFGSLGLEISTDAIHAHVAQSYKACMQQLGSLADMVYRLRYLNQDLIYLGEAGPNLNSLVPVLRKIDGFLKACRLDISILNREDDTLDRITTIALSCQKLLSPFCLNLTKDNLSKEINRVRQLGENPLDEILSQIEGHFESLVRLLNLVTVIT